MDGETSSDFSFGVRFGSHVRSHGSQSSEQIGKHSTFGRGTCFTCGRPGHKMMECPVNFGVSKYESVAGEDFKVCVDNLPPGIMWQEVKELFEREVGTTSYAMPRMEHGGQGSGIIGFERKVEQELALIKMDGYEFGGRRLQSFLELLHSRHHRLPANRGPAHHGHRPEEHGPHEQSPAHPSKAADRGSTCRNEGQQGPD